MRWAMQPRLEVKGELQGADYSRLLLILAVICLLRRIYLMWLRARSITLRLAVRTLRLSQRSLCLQEMIMLLSGLRTYSLKSTSRSTAISGAEQLLRPQI